MNSYPRSDILEIHPGGDTHISKGYGDVPRS